MTQGWNRANLFWIALLARSRHPARPKGYPKQEETCRIILSLSKTLLWLNSFKNYFISFLKNIHFFYSWFAVYRDIVPTPTAQVEWGYLRWCQKARSGGHQLPGDQTHPKWDIFSPASFCFHVLATVPAPSLLPPPEQKQNSCKNKPNPSPPALPHRIPQNQNRNH